MIFGKKPPVLLPLGGCQPQSVSEWLEVATWNLVPSAQARIRAEIETHYAQALQSYKANGSSDLAANTTALADLGDAKAAARRFSKQYLTVGEAESVERRLKAARRTGPLFYLPLIMLVCSIMPSFVLILKWAFAPAANGRFLFCAVALLVLALLYYALAKSTAGFLARRKVTLATVRRIILLERVKGLNLYMLNLANLAAMFMVIISDPFRDGLAPIIRTVDLG